MILISMIFLKFRRNESGNVALITALSALPMLGLFGLCIDYGIAVGNKSKLDAAADAAAVAAITTVQSRVLAKSTDAVAEGKARGLAVFAANAGKINFGSTGKPPIPEVEVSLSADQMTAQAKISYSTSVAAQFGRLFNVSKMNVSGSVQSTLGVGPNVEIYLMIDTSQSMGVAATQSDMDKLYKATAFSNGGSCVFACHDTDGKSSDTYQLAEKQGIRLRIDLIKDAVRSMIDKADDNSKLPNAKAAKIALYTFDTGLNSTLSQDKSIPSPPTSKYSDLRQAAAGIDLALDKGDYVNGQLYHADTYAQIALVSGTKTQGQAGNITDIIGKSGDGSSDASPRKFLFIMTDGTSDTADNQGQKVTEYDPAWVRAAKNNGVTIGVVYTTYLPFYNNNIPSLGFDTNYATWVAPINGPVSKIRLGLQDCVTAPSWFLEATDNAAIAAALTKLLAQAQSPPRLTN